MFWRKNKEEELRDKLDILILMKRQAQIMVGFTSIMEDMDRRITEIEKKLEKGGKK